MWFAFAAQAVVDTALAARYQELWGRTRAGLADRIARRRVDELLTTLRG
ncbi:hypothetical protein SAMN05216207_1001278 [Pseudonocardia ammonioxydans]|uniref:Uncharacterized protein n=1 Tax=Pseudonocardia ammonioxydans TaxID=260086 RepID=A0A1I4S7B0_PSUAM|nr:hypothetical protein [Pseudonocardia ammonioxydans]SFM60174.1 hypothetical protein SAMN05216207_1001278 [Pseudonocardia ammonioxydans]